MGLAEKLEPGSQKKILALDGGGIRGILAVEILAKIEELLRQKSSRGQDFVLADSFDFFAGTSTGAIGLRRYRTQEGAAAWYVADLQRTGRAVADQKVKAEHFAGF